ncbi:MAG: hypothetical protein K6B14_02890 [Lachnospiraceae bacterium]|nr:hypothetical protein [Lachnospiraceae bacterium]
MPYINPKLTIPVSDEKKEAIKTRLGQAVSILSKPESFLMVDIEDDHDIWFAGEKVEKGAYVAVEIYGNASSDAYNRMTAEICKILGEELDIPADRVYVKYHGVNDWGWNGRNF